MTHDASGLSDEPGNVRQADEAREQTGATRELGRLCRWSLVLAIMLFPAPLFGQLLSSISLSFASVPGAVPLSGAGTDSATLNFGSVSAFAPPNPGVSRAVGASSYTVSTTFGVRTTKGLLGVLSPSYTLKARLRNAHPLTWRVDGTTMSTTDITIGTSQPYGSIVPHALSFVVPFSRPAGAVTTVLEITAIAN
jgi:hypothetical protein